MDKLITVKLYRLGCDVQSLKIPLGSLISNFKKIIKLSEKISLYKENSNKEIEKVDLKYKLCDGDVLFATHPMIGSAEIKCLGKNWVVHKYDKDPKPSKFHAHDTANGDKLDILDGRLYNKLNVYKKKLSTKEHIIFLNELIKRALYKEDAEKIINFLEEKYNE